MLGIVVSRADSASTHVAEHLRDLADWTVETDDDRPDVEGGGDVWRLADVEMREFDDLHLELDGVAAAFHEPDLVVFASRHAGETDELLTAHHTGNFGPAEYGGDDHALARACPNAHSHVLESLAEHAPDNYEVGMECSHHGPTDVGAPSMFVEVGSAEPQWNDPDAARAVAKAILDLRGVDADAPRENDSRRHLVGFGGGHYAPRFERILRETDWSVGHVAADWCLDAMGDPEQHREVIDAALEQSAADYAVLDEERSDLRTVIEELGHEIVEETFVQETDSVPLSLVERVESRLGAVANGVRFGQPAEGYEGEIERIDLPEDLVAEANGIDATTAVETAQESAVAVQTTQAGKQLGTEAVVTARSERQSIVEALADILLGKYDDVTVTDSAVVAETSEFVPEKAATLGIPEGPAFGKLAAGQSVEVNGRTIDPDVVHEDRTRRFEY